MQSKQFRWWGYVWASPNTVLAIAVGLILSARFRLHEGVVEIYGPRVSWVLQHLPISALAMTVGHAIFGRDRAALDLTRRHEHVHVRQYERWGPAFIAVYLGSSVWLYLRGKDGYRENPFEIEAYAVDDPGNKLSG